MRARAWIVSGGLGLLAAGAFVAGCSVVKGAADAAADRGVISKEAAESTKQASDSTRKSMEDFTDSEEYYIGRGVSANVFTQYKPVLDEGLNAYVTRVGTAVALVSDQPETYAGYHFQVLDADEVNALAAPGGFIFITRGMLDLCTDEDMLACVLAHEVGHVIKKHGINSISKSRKVEAIKLIVGAGAAVATGKNVPELAAVFEGSLGDIAKAYKEGYGGGAEKEADTLAVVYAARAGYDPNALVQVFDAMQKKESVKQGGTFSSHPKAKDRVDTARSAIEDDKLAPASPPATRLPRFKAAVKG